jgi:hypothetical protein
MVTEVPYRAPCVRPSAPCAGEEQRAGGAAPGGEPLPLGSGAPEQGQLPAGADGAAVVPQLWPQRPPSAARVNYPSACPQPGLGIRGWG